MLFNVGRIFAYCKNEHYKFTEPNNNSSFQHKFFYAQIRRDGQAYEKE